MIIIYPPKNKQNLWLAQELESLHQVIHCMGEYNYWQRGHMLSKSVILACVVNVVFPALSNPRNTNLPVFLYNPAE